MVEVYNQAEELSKLINEKGDVTTNAALTFAVAALLNAGLAQDTSSDKSVWQTKRDAFLKTAASYLSQAKKKNASDTGDCGTDFQGEFEAWDNKPPVTEGYIGMERETLILKQNVIFPITQKKTLKIMNLRVNNILLYGPPGTGKSFLVGQLFASLRGKIGFVNLKSSSIKGAYVGQSEKCVRKAFETARNIARDRGVCVLFIDEVDTYAKKRTFSSAAGSQIEQNLTNAFLTEIEGVDTEPGPDDGKVVVVAASNAAPDELDSAFLSRIGIKLLVDLPSEADIVRLLKSAWTLQTPCFLTPSLVTSMEESEFEYLAAELHGRYFSTREITNLARATILNVMIEFVTLGAKYSPQFDIYYSKNIKADGALQLIDVPPGVLLGESDKNLCMRQITYEDAKHALSFIQASNTPEEMRKFYTYAGQHKSESPEPVIEPTSSLPQETLVVEPVSQQKSVSEEMILEADAQGEITVPTAQAIIDNIKKEEQVEVKAEETGAIQAENPLIQPLPMDLSDVQQVVPPEVPKQELSLDELNAAAVKLESLTKMDLTDEIVEQIRALVDSLSKYSGDSRLDIIATLAEIKRIAEEYMALYAEGDLTEVPLEGKRKCVTDKGWECCISVEDSKKNKNKQIFDCSKE